MQQQPRERKKVIKLNEVVAILEKLVIAIIVHLINKAIDKRLSKKRGKHFK